jgi:hypothetical protein
MTLKPLTLNEYFHAIIKQPVKETTMFEYLKNKWQELTTTKYEFVEEDPKLMDDDYWAFEMVTHEWSDEFNEVHPLKHTMIIEPHDTTWMDVLDRILEEMGKHYGYNIKEQVYYSVTFPLNELDDRTGKPFAGYGRCLNEDVLQQLLLAFPEAYETFPYHKPKNVFE